MWAKISSALKPRQVNEDDQSTSSQGEGLTTVFEQHPNLPVFHNQNHAQNSNPSPPGSPSRNGRRGMFKRMRSQIKDDDDSTRAPSPLLWRPQTLPKKMMSHFSLTGNGSQVSLGRASIETSKVTPENGARRSIQDIFRRPSLDLLKTDLGLSGSEQQQEDYRPSPASTERSGHEHKLGSVRSILRLPNTPGTGQNVRFFSRDAYRPVSSDESNEADYQSLPNFESADSQNSHSGEAGEQTEEQMSPFFTSPNSGPESSSTPAAAVRLSSSSSSSISSYKSRPRLSEVFSPLSDDEQVSSKSVDELIGGPIPAPDFNSIFDISDPTEEPSSPPGLGHDDDDPTVHKKVDTPSVLDSMSAEQAASVPAKPVDKGKRKQGSPDLSPVPETIFRPPVKDKPRLIQAFHDRSHSFSFGQTVFYSARNETNSNGSKSTLSTVRSSLSSEVSRPLSPADPPSRAVSPAFSNGRSRALSDTVFHSRALSPTGHPEADINDESSPELVMYSNHHEADPFSANANTYYTPQTMIPSSPPQKQHVRKTSKEENIIYSLQAQLALKTELCGQYEEDLRARDEMVEVLNKKVGDLDKEEGRKKSALRTWKKKVQELEKVVRMLEEELEGSRQESFERSVMDEASGEALRMLHRQIGALERERSDWIRKEKTLTEEVTTLQGLVKERSQDVENLREVLWKKEESERQLQEGIKEAKEQIEMMSNISINVVDEEELRKLATEKQQQKEEESERYHAAEASWELEKTELSVQLETAQVTKDQLLEQLESVKERLKASDDEFAVLKSELEAQWQHTEKSTEKIEQLQKEKGELENEKETLRQELQSLEDRTERMEVEWTEIESKRNELEIELQEVWSEKEGLEKERNQLKEQLQQEREQVGKLTRALQEKEDRVMELDQERQFALDNVARLEENIRKRDQELTESSMRVFNTGAEVEKLREEMSNLRREHSRDLDEKSRKMRDAVEEAAEARLQWEEAARSKAELEVENKTNKDWVSSLKEEIERLRKQMHELQQESADKEVKIVQITKQRAQDKEDIAGLNIALDSKQQELELIKRRLSVRATAGHTPAHPSKTYSRQPRESSVADAPPTVSRPPSVTSDSGRESVLSQHRKRPSDLTLTSSAIKISTLGKSTRVNTAAGPSRAPSRAEGSMAPSLMKSRTSLTPTPMPRPSLAARSALSKPPAVPQRRMSTTVERAQAKGKGVAPPISSPGSSSVMSTGASEVDEKENMPTRSTSKVDSRRNAAPVPA